MPAVVGSYVNTIHAQGCADKNIGSHALGSVLILGENVPTLRVLVQAAEG